MMDYVIKAVVSKKPALTMPTAETMCTKMVDIATTGDTLMWLAHWCTKSETDSNSDSLI